jgi:hypothetical protein
MRETTSLGLHVLQAELAHETVPELEPEPEPEPKLEPAHGSQSTSTSTSTESAESTGSTAEEWPPPGCRIKSV